MTAQFISRAGTAVIVPASYVVYPEMFGPTSTPAERVTAFQAAFDFCVSNGFAGRSSGLYEIDGTITFNGQISWDWGDTELKWVGADVTDLTEVMYRPQGGTEQEPSGKYVLLDTKGGTGSVCTGSLKITGSTPGGMTIAQAANIPANLVGVTASTGSSAGIVWGRLEVQGCGHGLWQGDQRGNGSPILPYTRWSGQSLKITFCLEAMSDGRGGNGFDEFTWQNIEIARCGMVNIVSNYTGGPIFLKGPRFSASNDVETPTLAVTAGSTSATLSAALTGLTVGTVLSVEGARDNGDGSKAIAHVSRVSAVSGTSVTLETAPDNTVAAARIIVARTGLLVSAASVRSSLLYIEGQTDAGVILKDGGKISGGLLEVSDGEYGSRYGHGVFVGGISANECTATLHQRSGKNNDNLKTMVAIGTLSDDPSYGECTVNITAQHAKNDFTKFDMIGGVRPESDHSAGYRTDPGVPMGLKNLLVSYPDGFQAYEVFAHGPASEAKLTTGNSFDALSANLRDSGNTDMTGVIGTGSCGSPSSGVVVKTAGGDGTWYEGIGARSVGDKLLVEFTVDATNGVFDGDTPGAAFQLFRSQDSNAPMLPNGGVPILAAGSFRVIVNVPDALVPNRAGFDCKAGATIAVSRMVVRLVEDA